MCIEYWELTAAQEEDLFARVQKGIPLTAAEKMRAMSGPWQELAKAFVNDFPRVFEITPRKGQSPAAKFQLVMGCFTQIFEVRDPSTADGTPALKCGTPAIKAFLEDSPTLDQNIRVDMAAVFRKMDHLMELDPETFQNTGRTFGSALSFLAVEFVTAAVLLSQYMDSRSDDMLLGDIRGLREHLHMNSAKEESRVTKQAWQDAWDYIDDLERIRGATDGITTPAPQETHSATRNPQAQETSDRTESPGWVLLPHGPPTPRATPPVPEASSPLTVKQTAKRKAPSTNLNEAAARIRRAREDEDVKGFSVNQPEQASLAPHPNPGGFVVVNSGACPLLGARLSTEGIPSHGALTMDPFTPLSATFPKQYHAQPLQFAPSHQCKESRRKTTVAQAAQKIDLTDDVEASEIPRPRTTSTSGVTAKTPRPPQLAIRSSQPFQHGKKIVKKRERG